MSQRRKQHKFNEVDRIKNLQTKTIIQRNLVYVTNIAYSIVDGLNLNEISEKLGKFEYFGQYGEVIKIIPNIKTLHNLQSTTGPSFSAYITFKTAESSIQCIRSTNGGWLSGKVLNASLGTTKYCSHFLRGKQCINPDCTYLHQLVSEKDYITKEELTAGKNRIDDNISQHISIDSEGNNYLSPIFTIEPIEIDLDLFQTDNPVLLKMVNRYKRLFVRDTNPHSPVHASLAPLRAFRYDQSDSNVIKSPNYIFFLYNTRTTDPEVNIPKEWSDCKKTVKKIIIKKEEIDNDSNYEENDDLEEQSEEELTENKEESLKEENTTTLDDTSDSDQVMVKDDYSESISPFCNETNVPFICKDYLKTFEIMNIYKGDVDSLIRYSKNEGYKTEEISEEQNQFDFILRMIEKMIDNDGIETVPVEEKVVEEVKKKEKQRVIVDEWTTVGKGLSLKKAKQNKKNKLNEVIIEEESEEEEIIEEVVKEEIKKRKENEEEKKENKKVVVSKREIEKRKMKEMEEKRREREKELELERIKKEGQEKLKNSEQMKKEEQEKSNEEEEDDDEKKNEIEKLHSKKKGANNKTKKKSTKKKVVKKQTELKKIETIESPKPPSRPPPSLKSRIIDPLEQLEIKVKELNKIYLTLLEKSNIQLQVLNERKIEIQPILCQYPETYFFIDH